jgi:calcium-dependent protein kinase
MNYKVSKVLGEGAYGKVFLCESIADPDFRVAVKVLNKADLPKEEATSIKQEIEILTKLDHPNIIKHYETYDDKRYVYLVMEYCNGGELFDKIISKEDQTFTESEASHIMEKLFKGINHCHSVGVAHRDIKPENIMIGRDGELKFIDFGLSKKYSGKVNSLKSVVGTPFYMAPEVIDGTYNDKCDVWSLGVLMYLILSGYLPFQGENKNDVFHKIKAGKYHFNHIEFQKVS